VIETAEDKRRAALGRFFVKSQRVNFIFPGLPRCTYICVVDRESYHMVLTDVRLVFIEETFDVRALL
jgi:hypothetical protein